MSFDCTADVLEHKRKVTRYLNEFSVRLIRRATVHDDSKLLSPEKEMFDEFTPLLKVNAVNTLAYEAARVAMGEALQHHYKANTHHPEHYKDGVSEMNLLDVVEMVCDWQAACEAKGVQMDLDYLCGRFHISDQLKSIIRNSLVD